MPGGVNAREGNWTASHSQGSTPFDHSRQDAGIRGGAASDGDSRPMRWEEMEDSHEGGKQRRLSERLVVLGIIITAKENEHDVVCRPSRVAARLQQIRSTVVNPLNKATFVMEKFVGNATC
jgi:hypothetical protein